MDFGTQLIGRTEKALNAILERLLAGPGLTERQWVALSLTIGGGSIPAALHIDGAAADRLVAQLAERGLVDAAGAVTARGHAVFREVRAAVLDVTHRLWGDLPEADLAVAGRVLDTVLTRANALLPA
ncbi:MarR family winged helix-turn-helix transcriptional regulator [Dactylosporangium sp. CA-052675]|uniref:MarR family winged helix-turn-helix transcriptional regulator n=1 Tax=Dactylosporangium sp. CA-052675 TaxID=3239927 RepID=UPI003D8AFFE5